MFKFLRNLFSKSKSEIIVFNGYDKPKEDMVTLEEIGAKINEEILIEINSMTKK